jgi:amino acid permease
MTTAQQQKCAVHRAPSDDEPVAHASQDILDVLKHQCSCDPVSMGEYLPSPRTLATTDEGARLLVNGVDSSLLEIDVESDLSPAQHKALQLSKLHDQQHATATVWGSMFTLTNTILGSGTLAVPFALASSGWLLGNAVMLAIAMVTRYSVYLLLSASDRAGVHCARTYESLGHFTMGALGTRLAEFTFIFGGFGTLVSYFMFITDLFSVVLGVADRDKWIVTCVCMAGMILPLSLTRRLGRLRFSSVLAVLSITYVVAFVLIAFLVVVNNNATVHAIDFSRVQAVRFEPGSVYTVTLLIAAFACHNTALPVYDELRNRSITRMDRAVFGAIAVAFVLYEAIGLCGYLQFGDATKDNILLNFSPAYVAQNRSIQFPLLVGRFCMGVALLLTTPIAMWPFRSCLLSVLLRHKNGGRQTPSSQATWWEFAGVTLASQLLILVCSIFVPTVKIPLSIVGSVSGSLLIFIMPSLFFMLQSPHPIVDRRHAGPLLMLATGVCVGVLGLSLTLFKIYKEHF